MNWKQYFEIYRISGREGVNLSWLDGDRYVGCFPSEYEAIRCAKRLIEKMHYDAEKELLHEVIES